MSDHVEQMLCLSTAHVRPETMSRLCTGDFDWLPSYRKEDPRDPEDIYGVFVLAGDISLESEAETADIPDDLLTVLEYAHRIGAEWIMFDGIRDMIDELPTFPWPLDIDPWGDA